jgi:hypothetical protein
LVVRVPERRGLRCSGVYPGRPVKSGVLTAMAMANAKKVRLPMLGEAPQRAEPTFLPAYAARQGYTW